MQEDQQPIPLRKWSERSNTVGMLPGGTTFQVNCLIQVLSQLPAARDSNLSLTTAMGEDVTTSADELCKRQLSPMGLAVRDGETWRATEFSAQWLSSTSDSLTLAAHIHTQCKFIGELIHEITETTTHDDLLRVARSKYFLSWEKLDPIRRRIAWLRSLGMIEMWGRRLVVTELGTSLLRRLTLATSEEAAGQGASNAGKTTSLVGPSSVVSERLLKVTPSSLANRRDPIGYIPRGANRSAATRLTALEGLRKAVGLIDVGATVDEFREYAQRDLAVNAGSFDSVLHSLRHLEIIELIAYNKYGPTELAYACLEVGREADLARFLHSKFSFIGELLDASRELVSTSQLLTVARSRYSYGGDAAEIRTRVALLADCGFLEKFDKSRARITAIGEELLRELPLQASSTLPPDSPDKGEEPLEQPEHDLPLAVDDIIDRLSTCGTTGSRDKEFEATVREAFETLGFRSEHIGGKSDTDVLATAELPADLRYSAVIEAKSTSQGSVAEGQINFEGIKRHRRKHDADHAAIVGVRFPKSVHESAAANKIAVITIEDLTSLLQEHSRTPLTLLQLRRAFDPEAENLSGLGEESDSLRNDLALTAAIIAALRNEAAEDDPEARGFASPGTLRYALRGTDLPFRPTSEQILARLDVLTHPTVAAVHQKEAAKGETVYAVADSPHNVALRLRALADQIDRFASSDDE